MAVHVLHSNGHPPHPIQLQDLAEGVGSDGQEVGEGCRFPPENNQTVLRVKENDRSGVIFLDGRQGSPAAERAGAGGGRADKVQEGDMRSEGG